MAEVVKGNFSEISIGDRRAMALAMWLEGCGSATVEEMRAEMERIKKALPAPEDQAD